MSDYLARLRALAPQKRLPQELTQLTQAPSVSSVSDRSRHISPAGPPCVSSVSGSGSHTSACAIEDHDQPKVAFSIVALQRDADRRNLQALREGRTDRFCSCGRLARLAWPEGNRREVWRCDDCAQTAGRA
jgi:hypothetical protein